MTAACEAKSPVLVFLLLFVPLEDFVEGYVSIGWGIRVSDTDIEDRSCSATPESVDGDVPAEFWAWGCVVVACIPYVLTDVNEWFVRDRRGGEGLATQVTPLGRKIIVALEDQTSLLA